MNILQAITEKQSYKRKYGLWDIKLDIEDKMNLQQ
jgi:hypothetical protein